ncbi:MULTISPECIES: SRPBCC family protein [unclassified Nocardioides]|uniref:SRPBCC family protein n=1 Tax=unclassified Nocardioides TaxID=2615069 RepID=UPI0006F7A767|nr:MULTISPECIES: SRPBCC family protein [unclassified Nocardioides]KRA31335.1 polyketide cyclase [Nocardioides sp. Root614]KRA87956.1 polyketide cyclase [Nocardioides sp. Root682]
MRRSFAFESSWEVAAPVERVAETVVDLEHYPEWWPQVRAVAKLGPDTAWVRCRSTLPYTLDLVLDAVSRTPPVVEVRISGDLEGYARFTLSSTEMGTRLDFAQEVEVSGMLGILSGIARPVMTWNHDRMMAGCREGLVRHVLAR